MAERADLIQRIYGFDWATVRSRREGFDELGSLVTDDFDSQLSPELGERVLSGVQGLEMFVEAVEQDFSEFRYDADEVEEIAGDRVLVLGRIFARARATGMPLSGQFGHIWIVRDGRAAHVEAHRDHDEARKAAGAG
ncbi:MAG TPA: nuclear transport factor 2 family protein [Solirubrobacterales bacterium]|nr:nuclear transport factor 2 family protein [Solirubrobacterales bacterium]